VPSVDGLDLDLDLDREPRGRDRKRGNCSADIARHVMPYKKTKSIDGYESETKIYKRITLRNTQAKNLQQEKKGDIS